MKKFLCRAFLALALSQVSAAPDPNFHIYLAFGQSNMEGQGTIESQDKTVDSRFQMLSTIDNFYGRALGTWNDAIPPLANMHGGLGPSDYFGRTLVEKLDPQIRVGIVVVAVAGCSIVLFDPPVSQDYWDQQAGWFMDIVKDYGDDPYQRLVDMAIKAKEDGVIKGIIFHQGETDSDNKDWPNKVKKVYDRLVKDAGLDENIPFFAGEVPYGGSANGANNNIRQLPSKSPNFYIVSADGLNDLDFMRLHFSSQGYRDFGKRYAEKVMEILGDKLNPVTEAPSSSSAAGSRPGPETVSSSSEDSQVSSSSESAQAILYANNRFASIAPSKNGEIRLRLAETEAIAVKIYTPLGKEVLDMSGNYLAGTNTLVLTGRLSAGRYIVSVKGEKFQVAKPIIVK